MGQAGVELSKILTADRIRLPMRATDKNSAIAELIEVLHQTGALSDPAAALEAVMRREAERSTGIGYGLAIPHGKTSTCKQLAIAAGKPAKPIDFESIDQRPVTLIFLLVSPPDQTSQHIQALARISRLMNIEGFREAVNRASTPQELHDAIAAHEARETAENAG